MDMRIRENDRRTRLYENLKDATGEGTKSGALDTAAKYYVKMRGDNPAVPTGQLTQLIKTADKQGSVTAEEIVAILDTDEIPLSYRSQYQIGKD